MQKLIVRTSGSTMQAGFSPFFTGRTKQMVSPLTGRLQTYFESYTIRVTNSSPTAPNLDTIKTKINTDALTNNVDAQCDEILLIQGAISDSYKIKTWIAEEQPNLAIAMNKQGRLIADIIIAAIILLIAIIVGAIVAVWAINSAMAVADRLLPGKPKYVTINPNDPSQTTVWDDYAAYITAQHVLYWYVCPKCGAGFGLKSSYPNITDVPTAEKAAFDEHVANCQGIPQTNYDLTPFFTWIVIGVAGIIGIIYFLPKLINAMRGK